MIFNRHEKEDETGIIKNMSKIDLRDATAESLAEIKGIKNAGIIILPTDAEPEFFANYAKIPKKNIGSELRLEKNVTVKTHSGCCVIDSVSDPENTVVITNGICVVMNVNSEKPLRLVVNGITIIQNGSNAEVISSNGICNRAEFNYVRVFNDRVTVTADFLKALNDSTAIVAGDRIIVDDSVSSQLILDKKIIFCAGDDIICTENNYGAVAATSFAGDSIRTE